MLPILAWSVLAAVAPLMPVHVVHAYQSVGRYAAGDRGVDLAGVPGQVVASATAGRVLFAGPVAGMGVVSVALGDGRRLTYEPVSPSVRVGERLSAGQPIGRLAAGRAGCPAPACLHWGLVTGRGPTVAYADPMALLGRSPVRLLPLDGRAPVTAPTSGPTPAARRALPPGSLGGPPAHPPAAPVRTGTSAPVGVAVGSGAGLGLATLAVGAGHVRRRGRASRRPGAP
ncbi:MAG TPA: M23 family metallopeptidase [Mycobacteriales bacterium]